MKFNLEYEIKIWRRKLRKHTGFEDADIVELEDHLRQSIEYHVEQGMDEREAYWYEIQTNYQDLNMLSNEFNNEKRPTVSILPLLNNYLKIGFRKLGKQRFYQGINIAGLILGLICIYSISLYVNQELSFDRFHENSDQLHRINVHFTRTSGTIRYPLIPPAFGPELVKQFPEIENSSRLRYSYSVLMQNNTKSFFEEKVFYAEQSFLDMFSFDGMYGDVKTALLEPNSIVLTESMAMKYFGRTDVLDESLKINNDTELKVSGVIKDVPHNSHFYFDCLISFETFTPGPGALEPMTSWKWLGFLTYVYLNDNTNIPELETKIRDMYLSNLEDNVNLTIDIELQPLVDIYLTSESLSNPQGGLFKINSKSNIITISIVGGLVLFIAIFNYFNIQRLLHQSRGKEIGIRKVFGSSKYSIVAQLTLEVLVTLVIANIGAFLILFLLPGYLSYIPQLDVQNLAPILGTASTILLIFLLFGLILYSTSVTSENLLRSNSIKQNRSQGKMISSRLVLLMQFCISGGLILASLIMVKQLKFLSNKELGYDSSGIMVVNYRSDEMNNMKESVRDELQNFPYINTVSFGPTLDGSTSGSPLRLREWTNEQNIQTAYFGVDYSFEDIIDLDIVEGRGFIPGNSQDSAGSVMINETLARQLDVDDPIGRTVVFAAGEYEIIGIYKNFHYQSLHHEIGPMALIIWTGPPRHMLIRYDNANIPMVISDLEEKWSTLFNGAFPFEFKFLDDQLNGMYSSEKMFSDILGLFTGLAIFLAFLGLFGLSSIAADTHLRRIAIMRVLGANIQEIVKMFSTGYLYIIAGSLIMVIPLVYYLMGIWLGDFAYQVDIGILPSLQTIGLVLVVTLVTIGYQINKVVSVNSAEILKDES